MSHPLLWMSLGIRTYSSFPKLWLGVWSVVIMDSCVPDGTFVLSFTQFSKIFFGFFTRMSPVRHHPLILNPQHSSWMSWLMWRSWWNRWIILKLQKRLQVRIVTWVVKVKVHRGDPLNEEADIRVEMGIRKTKGGHMGQSNQQDGIPMDTRTNY